VRNKPQDQFWGDRTCDMTDPYNHDWTVRSHAWAQYDKRVCCWGVVIPA
jgi:uncharacterized glyoxalase superfamily protein PhnB